MRGRNFVCNIIYNNLSLWRLKNLYTKSKWKLIWLHVQFPWLSKSCVWGYCPTSDTPYSDLSGSSWFNYVVDGLRVLGHSSGTCKLLQKGERLDFDSDYAKWLTFCWSIEIYGDSSWKCFFSLPPLTGAQENFIDVRYRSWYEKKPFI